ncbi:hypothetical protein AMECASPLE_026676 [Ameca splendens]|uniref:CUB domain-containing protein n=1 Tax=Ameca splendens TaxID=208324 RepID=A0ABV1ABB6_9TELE
MRIFILSLLVQFRCGAELLSELYGSLQSPNFPEPYPRDTELNWNISVPDGFRISLFFSHFDLEPSYLCEYDFVKVPRGNRPRDLDVCKTNHVLFRPNTQQRKPISCACIQDLFL